MTVLTLRGEMPARYTESGDFLACPCCGTTKNTMLINRGVRSSGCLQDVLVVRVSMLCDNDHRWEFVLYQANGECQVICSESREQDL